MQLPAPAVSRDRPDDGTSPFTSKFCCGHDGNKASDKAFSLRACPTPHSFLASTRCSGEEGCGYLLRSMYYSLGSVTYRYLSNKVGRGLKHLPCVR